MWKDSNRNIVVIFQPNVLKIVGFYVRHSAKEMINEKTQRPSDPAFLRFIGFLNPFIKSVLQNSTNPNRHLATV